MGKNITQVRPGRFDIGVIVVGQCVRAPKIQIQDSGALLQGPVHRLEDQRAFPEDQGGNLTVRTFDRQVAISLAALLTSSNGMRVDIEPSAFAKWRDLLAAII